MDIIKIILIGIIIGLIIIIPIIIVNKNKKLSEYKSQRNKELELYFQQRYNEKEKALQSLDAQIKIQEQRVKEKEVDMTRHLAVVRQRQEDSIQHEIEDWARNAQNMANLKAKKQQDQFLSEWANYEAQLDELKAELNEYKLKRDVINQEILRSRAVSEQQDFYRIQIPETYKRDIAIFESIKPQLSKIDILNKLIYDNYVAKSVKEMAKRVLAGKDPPGIYKVTNVQTNEIYIGKSTTCATRWTNHCKSAYGLDGVADSFFQRALHTYGIDQFTWELLEEVPKEKLTEREKYYINFYQTTKYGYNMREG